MIQNKRMLICVLKWSIAPLILLVLSLVCISDDAKILKTMLTIIFGGLFTGLITTAIVQLGQYKSSRADFYRKTFENLFRIYAVANVLLYHSANLSDSLEFNLTSKNKDLLSINSTMGIIKTFF